MRRYIWFRDAEYGYYINKDDEYPFLMSKEKYLYIHSVVARHAYRFDFLSKFLRTNSTPWSKVIQNLVISGCVKGSFFAP